MEWAAVSPRREKRRGLGLLFLAPLVCLLLAYPLVYALLIPVSVLLAPVALLFYPAAHPGRRTEEATLEMAAILSAFVVLLVYCWLLASSLRRFTGAWHRGLFLQLIAWIGGLGAAGILVLSKLNYLPNSQIFSLADY
jgi:hypothetical protein